MVYMAEKQWLEKPFDQYKQCENIELYYSTIFDMRNRYYSVMFRSFTDAGTMTTVFLRDHHRPPDQVDSLSRYDI